MKYENIGRIGNYYGGLHVKKVGDKYFWIIENYDTDFEDITEWDEIPKKLYKELIKYK